MRGRIWLVEAAGAGMCVWSMSLHESGKRPEGSYQIREKKTHETTQHTGTGN